MCHLFDHPLSAFPAFLRVARGSSLRCHRSHFFCLALRSCSWGDGGGRGSNSCFWMKPVRIQPGSSIVITILVPVGHTQHPFFFLSSLCHRVFSQQKTQFGIAERERVGCSNVHVERHSSLFAPESQNEVEGQWW